MSEFHTTGQLQLEDAMSTKAMLLNNSKGEAAGEVLWVDMRNPADARRMVACWNACRHISTKSLEENGAVGFEQVIELRNIYERAMKGVKNAEGKTA